MSGSSPTATAPAPAPAAAASFTSAAPSGQYSASEAASTADPATNQDVAQQSAMQEPEPAVLTQPLNHPAAEGPLANEGAVLSQRSGGTDHLSHLVAAAAAAMTPHALADKVGPLSQPPPASSQTETQASARDNLSSSAATHVAESSPADAAGPGSIGADIASTSAAAAEPADQASTASSSTLQQGATGGTSVLAVSPAGDSAKPQQLEAVSTKTAIGSVPESAASYAADPASAHPVSQQSRGLAGANASQVTAAADGSHVAGNGLTAAPPGTGQAKAEERTKPEEAQETVSTCKQS